MLADYPRFYDGHSGPTEEALNAASTPSGTFFYFMKLSLWEDIATASNNYFDETLDERVEGIYNRHIALENKKPHFKRKDREKIRVELKKSKTYLHVNYLCICHEIYTSAKIQTHELQLSGHGSFDR
ncbi:hypothetical protein PHMEG_00028521 [Phytophthora megakarya]|uniref:Uncharacterized protein n=1 Tax=Phytophthora megakarya TaxID=4795 RepID=A0A225V601_9STRA|nr:hypothetical protein PHMEG_00028521 [Phytophthora megakarya]